MLHAVSRQPLQLFLWTVSGNRKSSETSVYLSHMFRLFQKQRLIRDTNTHTNQTTVTTPRAHAPSVNYYMQVYPVGSKVWLKYMPINSHSMGGKLFVLRGRSRICKGKIFCNRCVRSAWNIWTHARFCTIDFSCVWTLHVARIFTETITAAL